jgi:hypothetical protein
MSEFVGKHLIFGYSNSTVSSGSSNSTHLPIPSKLASSPILSSTEKQAIIDAAMNVTGIKAWSNHWQYISMDFLGNGTNGNVTWHYAVVRLILPSNVNASFYCPNGWGAGAKVDLVTKQVVQAYYPTMKDHDCNIVSGGPLVIPEFPFAILTLFASIAVVIGFNKIRK